MELTEATRVLLAQAAGNVDVRRQVQAVLDDLTTGHQVDDQRLLAMLGEAAEAGVLTTLRANDPAAHEEVVMALLLEVDRLSDDPVRV